MVAVLKKRKSKSAQHRYLYEHRPVLMELLDLKRFPARSTYFDRYRRVHPLFEAAIRLQGKKAVADGVADATSVAVDQSKVCARGPEWNWKNRKEGCIPKGLHGVDRESRWGYSSHRGWVQGYSYEVVVTASKGSTVLPLMASVQTANVREGKTFGAKISQLQHETRYVLADAGYDSNAFGDRIEYDDRWRLTGRRFICASNRRADYERPLKRPLSKARMADRRRRRRRLEFFDSPAGRRHFARRGKSVEPFNEWFKSLFEIDGRAWHRGLRNNQTQILAAIFGYQLLIRYNARCGRSNGQIKWILDCL